MAQFDKEVMGGLKDIRKISIGGYASVGEKNAPRVGEKNAPRVGEKNAPRVGEKNAPRVGEKNAPRVGEKNAPRSVQKEEVVRIWPRAKQVLDAIFSKSDLQQIMDETPDYGNLKVSVHIWYETRQKDADNIPMQMALRNIPEGEIAVEGKDGKQRGNDIRLKYDTSVETDGALLVWRSWQKALWDAHNKFVRDDQIKP